MATFVQSKRLSNGNGTSWTAGTPVNLSFDSAVTTGNTVIVVVGQSSTSSVHSVSDATNGSYTSVITNSGTSFSNTIAAFRNATGGFQQVSVNPSVSGVGQIVLFEVSGSDNNAAAITGTDTVGAATNTLTAASSGLSGTGFVVAGITTSANRNVTDHESAAGYTLSTNASTNNKHIKFLAGMVTSNRGQFTVDSTGVTYRGVMAIFPDPSGGPFPHFLRRALHGGFVTPRGGVI